MLTPRAAADARRTDILREFTGQARNRKFIYQSYIQLFHENEPGAST